MGLVGSLPLRSPHGGLSRVPAPGVTPWWAQWGLCPLDHPEVGLGGGLCPWDHPGVGSVRSLPLGPPQDVLSLRTPHRVLKLSLKILSPTSSHNYHRKAEHRGSCFCFTGSCGFNSLCCLFSVAPPEGQLCVTSQGCPWAPAHQESRTLSGLHGFSKDKWSGKRGGISAEPQPAPNLAAEKRVKLLL